MYNDRKQVYFSCTVIRKKLNFMHRDGKQVYFSCTVIRKKFKFYAP